MYCRCGTYHQQTCKKAMEPYTVQTSRQSTGIRKYTFRGNISNSNNHIKIDYCTTRCNRTVADYSTQYIAVQHSSYIYHPLPATTTTHCNDLVNQSCPRNNTCTTHGNSSAKSITTNNNRTITHGNNFC